MGRRVRSSRAALSTHCTGLRGCATRAYFTLQPLVTCTATAHTMHFLRAALNAPPPLCADVMQLCSAMEYASGGELFDRIVRANRFSEDEARYFFQQLISGVAWCHKEVRGAPGGRGRLCRCQARRLPGMCSSVMCRIFAGDSKPGDDWRAAPTAPDMQAESQLSCIASKRGCRPPTCLSTQPAHASPAPPTPAGRVPPRPEAGEHAAGRPASAAPQNLRLWLLKGATRCMGVAGLQAVLATRLLL